MSFIGECRTCHQSGPIARPIVGCNKCPDSTFLLSSSPPISVTVFLVSPFCCVFLLATHRRTSSQPTWSTSTRIIVFSDDNHSSFVNYPILSPIYSLCHFPNNRLPTPLLLVIQTTSMPRAAELFGPVGEEVMRGLGYDRSGMNGDKVVYT